MSMKYIIPVLLFFVLFSVLSVAYTKAKTTDSAATRIELDQENNTGRILVDGQEVIMIDALGLHVTGNIYYTGFTRDLDIDTRRLQE